MVRISLLILLITLGPVSVGHAFSSETANDAFKGGNVSNFADPDEQQPAFLTGPGDVSSQTTSRQPSVSIDQNTQREGYLGLSQGFDHAYAHQRQ